MKFSLGYQVLIAAIFGIFCGLFFGPLCLVLKPIAIAFTMLVRMVVLPYLCFSLIHGLGSMTPDMGKKLIKRGWPFPLILWSLMYLLIALIAQLIPKPVMTLISTESLGQHLAEHFISYVIPENPFYDLANNIVPAVVIFSMVLGIGLMHVEKKEHLCGFFERMTQTIEKFFVWLAAISPIGAFAHLAVASGTVHFKDLYKLEFYVVTFVLTSLFITFWVLPLLLSSLTPLTYRQVLEAYRSVCLLPFVTGLSTLSLPFLYSYLRKFTIQAKEMHKHIEQTTQTILPVAYSFGQIGNCMLLFFFFFLSSYYRHPFSPSDEWLLGLLMIPMSLGSVSTSLGASSFLIQQLNFPEGALELYMETSAITNNFQVLMSVASVLTLIILTIYAFYGLLEVKWKLLCIRLGTTLAFFAVLIFGSKSSLPFEDHYQDLYLNLRIADVISNPVPAKVFREGERTQVDWSSTPSDKTPLQEILESGILKVGYDPMQIPYAYFNLKNELVGYDIAYAYQLARELDCKLEFIPVHLGDMGRELEWDLYNIGMSSFIMTEDRLRKMDFTHSYATENNVLIVPADRKEEFMDLSTISQRQGIKIVTGGAYIGIAKRHFPKATIISSSDIDPLLKGEADACLWSRVSAFVWCLSHPEFVGINFHGEIGNTFLSYPIRSNSVAFQSILNEWLLLKQQSGFEKQMYNYWIEGLPASPREPRWSILRNVLHVGKSTRINREP